MQSWAGATEAHSLRTEAKLAGSSLTHDLHLAYDAKQRLLLAMEHIRGTTRIISTALENDFPAALASQSRASTNLNNLTTIATFFSAVTATTLQMSYQTTEAHFDDVAVNTLYFASLILSVAAALHSLLARVWTEATQ